MSLSIYYTHTLTQLGRMSERGEALSSERERKTIGDHLFCLWVLLLPLVLILSLRKLQGFVLYGFLEKNYLCLLSLMLIVVHVILLDKILISYYLNDKNLTPQTSKIKISTISIWKWLTIFILRTILGVVITFEHESTWSPSSLKKMIQIGILVRKSKSKKT